MPWGLKTFTALSLSVAFLLPVDGRFQHFQAAAQTSPCIENENAPTLTQVDAITELLKEPTFLEAGRMTALSDQGVLGSALRIYFENADSVTRLPLRDPCISMIYNAALIQFMALPIREENQRRAAALADIIRDFWQRHPTLRDEKIVRNDVDYLLFQHRVVQAPGIGRAHPIFLQYVALLREVGVFRGRARASYLRLMESTEEGDQAYLQEEITHWRSVADDSVCAQTGASCRATVERLMEAERLDMDITPAEYATCRLSLSHNGSLYQFTWCNREKIERILRG